MWILITLFFATVAVVEFSLLLSAWRRIFDQDDQIERLEAVATFYKAN